MSATSSVVGNVVVYQGKLYYLPNNQYYGMDTFKVTAINSSGDTLTRDVYLDILPTSGNALIAEYLFEDPTDLGKDTSGNNNHGVVMNSPTSVDGKVGKAISLGSGNGITGLPGFYKGQTFTMNLWININSPSTVNYMLHHGYWDDASGAAWELRPEVVRNSGDVELIGRGVDASSVESPLIIRKAGNHYGSWNMVTIIANGTKASLFVNGNHVGTDFESTGPEFFTPDQAGFKHSIGYSCIYGYLDCRNEYYFNGRIDNYRIYGKALSTAEIQALYTETFAVNEPPQGAINIVGNAVVGETLTITNTLTDADGLGEFTYQWLRDGTAINGAVGATYTVNAVDVGTTISVRVQYVDGRLTVESVDSQNQLLVSAVPAEIESLTITPSLIRIGDGMQLNILVKDVVSCFDTNTPETTYYSGPTYTGLLNQSLDPFYESGIQSLSVTCSNGEASVTQTIELNVSKVIAPEALSRH